MVGFGDYDSAVAALEGMLKDRDYVCGKQFSAADVYVGSTVCWGIDFSSLPKLPAFVAYRERMIARPAYQRVKQICAAKAEEMKAGG